MNNCSLLLASGSPRRAELLRSAGYSFEIAAVDLQEVPQAGESALQYGLRISKEKAQAGLRTLAEPASWVVLGADTEVLRGRRIYGKPDTPLHAREMLQSLSGRRHRVLSAVALVSQTRSLCLHRYSEVEFRDLSRTEIDAYVESGEVFGKAGAYAIQGLAAGFVKQVRGSYTGVIGLPVFETCAALAEMGVQPEWLQSAIDSSLRASL